ncbi:MAG: DUF134 domain-containing protein [Spirochaetia bacterium]|nr:DUF134 domain-containing protein [Spirochaetia bacterium]
MPRPVSRRRVGASPVARAYKPAGVPLRELEEVILSLDELEALRLADLEGLYQEACAVRMGISRQTFGRIVESARRKVADALVNGKALAFEGGKIQMEETMNEYKIAVPADGENVNLHFGSSRDFAVFTVKDGEVIDSEMYPAPNGAGCKSGSAGGLARKGVTVMLAGGMGEGAARVMESYGIKAVRGVSGEIRAAVDAYVEGKLKDSGSNCAGHEHGDGHDCGHHH